MTSSAHEAHTHLERCDGGVGKDGPGAGGKRGQQRRSCVRAHMGVGVGVWVRVRVRVRVRARVRVRVRAGARTGLGLGGGWG